MIQNTPVFAQLHERFLARLIDAIVTLPMTLLIVQMLRGQDAFAGVVTFLFGVAYYAFFHAGRWAATPGKRLVGLSVWNADGSRLSLKNSAARELAVLMPTYPIYLSFISPDTARFLVLALAVWWYGQVLFSQQRMAMHDKICATRVKVMRP